MDFESDSSPLKLQKFLEVVSDIHETQLSTVFKY